MKKRFLMPEAYWDTALLERWLEEKAVQGWRPVSFSRYGSGKFEPAEPRKPGIGWSPCGQRPMTPNVSGRRLTGKWGGSLPASWGTIGSMPARTHRRRSCLQIPLPCV
ncbi:hypothetical protein [Oscillibacter sp.]|uniref:hypothetical protein n=1 Tax=Oscillibacter sp. TaxID=1945593 RepID=UPI0025794B53|nr:hypothetical protein [Oscillibacter sp.]